MTFNTGSRVVSAVRPDRVGTIVNTAHTGPLDDQHYLVQWDDAEEPQLTRRVLPAPEET